MTDRAEDPGYHLRLALGNQGGCGSCARLREELSEAKAQAKHGWDRHAEKDAAYQVALDERDLARRMSDVLDAEIDRINIAMANISGAILDSGAVLPEDPSKWGETIRAIVAERDQRPELEWERRAKECHCDCANCRKACRNCVVNGGAE